MKGDSLQTSAGDEEPIEVIMEALKEAGYKAGDDMLLLLMLRQVSFIMIMESIVLKILRNRKLSQGPKL